MEWKAGMWRSKSVLLERLSVRGRKCRMQYIETGVVSDAAEGSFSGN